MWKNELKKLKIEWVTIKLKKIAWDTKKRSLKEKPKKINEITETWTDQTQQKPQMQAHFSDAI